MPRSIAPDIFIVNPSSRLSVYQSLGERLTAVENPIWAGLLATYCRNSALSVELLDAEALEWSAEQVADEVRTLKPTLVVIVVYGHQPSASTQSMVGASAVCNAIKESTPHQPVLFMGGHVAALPERTLLEEKADYVASGEGLETSVSLLNALKTRSPDLSRVPGLWFRDGETIRNTPESPLIRNLDQRMPAIAWDLLPMERYRAHNWHCLDGSSRQPYAALYTTLGCPFRCTFCCIQSPFKRAEQSAGLKETVSSYRFWSADSVLAQIDHLVKVYGVRNIKIADEMFVLNRRHVLAICEGLIQRGYPLNLWAYARIDTIQEGMLEKLKLAGFQWLAFGIESGSSRVRSSVDKNLEQNSISEVIAQVHAAGIHVIANYIFGLPEDDLESMRETLSLAQDLDCAFSNFNVAMAYPGSPLFHTAKRQNLALPKRWSGYSQHSSDCLPLSTKYLSSEEVLQFRDAAFTTYFSHPRYQTSIRKHFGEKGIAVIEGMLRTPFSRGSRETPSSRPAAL